MRNHIAQLRIACLKALSAACAAIWLWLLLITKVPIETRGAAGYITSILDGLYVVGVPLLGIVTMLLAVAGLVRRSSFPANIATLIAVAAVLGFWAWSLSPQGQFQISK